MPSLSLPELERVYDDLAEAIDHAGPERSELFLTKLALLLAHEVGQRARVAELLQTALRDL